MTEHGNICHRRSLLVQCMNLSGAKTKLQKINECLVSSPYDIFALQETWFDESVLDSNFINGTDYFCFRSDRCNSLSGKIKGGGVMTCVSNRFVTERLIVKRKLLTEYVICKIMLDTLSTVIINVYLPSTTSIETLSKCVDEISYLVLEVRKKFPNIKIVMVGDFNMPFINWNMFNDGQEQLHVIASSLQDILWQYSFKQWNFVLNSGNALLDLCLSDYENIEVSVVDPNLEIDEKSLHHSPLEFKILFDIPDMDMVIDSDRRIINNSVF